MIHLSFDNKTQSHSIHTYTNDFLLSSDIPTNFDPQTSNIYLTITNSKNKIISQLIKNGISRKQISKPDRNCLPFYSSRRR